MATSDPKGGFRLEGMPFGGQQSRTADRWALPFLRVGGALLVAFAASRLAHHPPNGYLDFNDHYFGAWLERHGISYTNSDALRHMVSTHAKRQTIANDVVGTPMLVALLFVPLTFLSLGNAHLVWDILAIASVAGGTYKAAGSTRWPLWAALAAISPCLMEAFHFGNPALITYGLLAYAFGALRDGQSVRAGIALGIATAFKLYPAFAFIPLVYKREWKAIAAAISTIAVTLVVSLAILGPEHMALALHQLQKYSGVNADRENAGLPALVKYYATSTLLAKIAGCTTLAIGAVVLWARRHNATETLFGVALMFAVLGSQYSWQMYFAVSILGLLSYRDFRPSRRQIAAASIAGVLSLGWAYLVVPASSSASHFASLLQALGMAGVIGLTISVTSRVFAQR